VGPYGRSETPSAHVKPVSQLGRRSVPIHSRRKLRQAQPPPQATSFPFGGSCLFRPVGCGIRRPRRGVGLEYPLNVVNLTGNDGSEPMAKPGGWIKQRATGEGTQLRPRCSPPPDRPLIAEARRPYPFGPDFQVRPGSADRRGNAATGQLPRKHQARTCFAHITRPGWQAGCSASPSPYGGSSHARCRRSSAAQAVAAEPSMNLPCNRSAKASSWLVFLTLLQAPNWHSAVVEDPGHPIATWAQLRQSFGKGPGATAQGPSLWASWLEIAQPP